MKWWLKRRGELPPRSELDQAVSEGMEVGKTLATPGWKIIEAEIERLIAVETKVLLACPADRLMTAEAVGLQQNVCGMRRAVDVPQSLTARGSDALQRLKAGRFRG